MGDWGLCGGLGGARGMVLVGQILEMTQGESERPLPAQPEELAADRAAARA